MKRVFQLLAVAGGLATANAQDAASEKYAMAISLDGGGNRVTSANYAQNIIVTPLSGRSVATFSVVMALGFGTRLNTEPTAVDDIHSHPLDTPVDITGSSLIANDFDPEGDALSVVSVPEMTSAGGTLTLTGQTITYTPPAALTGYDQFQYVIADSNGDTSTATVTLAIAPRLADQSMNTVSMTRQADGKYLIRFRQIMNWNLYAIETSHDIASPEWQTVVSVQAGADGIVEALVDSSLIENTFFRAVVF